MISENLASTARLPIVLVVCTTFLFYYLGLSFFSGVGVYVVAFVFNLLLSKIQARLQKVYMAKQDARLNITTESLNNIKMLKLYSWTSQFEEAIDSKRDAELAV